MADESEPREKIARCLAEVRGDPETEETFRLFGCVSDEDIIELSRLFGGFPELVTESEILEALTSKGTIPIEYCFVLDERLTFWHPGERSLWCSKLGDESLKQASLNYLRAKGLDFQRARELLEWAESHDWPGLEQLRQELADRVAREKS